MSAPGLKNSENNVHALALQTAQLELQLALGPAEQLLLYLGRSAASASAFGVAPIVDAAMTSQKNLPRAVAGAHRPGAHCAGRTCGPVSSSQSSEVLATCEGQGVKSVIRRPLVLRAACEFQRQTLERKKKLAAKTVLGPPTAPTQTPK